MKDRYSPVVLILDDDIDDHLVVKLIWKEKNSSLNIISFYKADDAIFYLWDQKKYSIPYPKLMIMDINMPGKDGKQTLKEIREFISLEELPIIMFSTSDNKEDMKFCYQHGANEYLKKGDTLTELESSLNLLYTTWLT